MRKATPFSKSLARTHRRQNANEWLHVPHDQAERQTFVCSKYISSTDISRCGHGPGKADAAWRIRPTVPEGSPSRKVRLDCDRLRDIRAHLAGLEVEVRRGPPCAFSGELNPSRLHLVGCPPDPLHTSVSSSLRVRPPSSRRSRTPVLEPPSTRRPPAQRTTHLTTTRTRICCSRPSWAQCRLQAPLGMPPLPHPPPPPSLLWSSSSSCCRSTQPLPPNRFSPLSPHSSPRGNLLECLPQRQARRSPWNPWTPLLRTSRCVPAQGNGLGSVGAAKIPSFWGVGGVSGMRAGR